MRTTTLVLALSLAAAGSVFPTGLDAQVGKPVTIIDPNVAGEQELGALPHMTPALAKVIVSGRPYLSMVDLNVALAKSLNKQQLTELYGRIFIAGQPEHAARDEILLIPGVGERMLHEFEEYRPYRSSRSSTARSTSTSTTRSSRASSSTSSCPSPEHRDR